MHQSLSYKTKQFFFVLIKLSIVVGCFYFVYNKLVNNGTLDFSNFMHFLNKNNVFSPKNIVFLLILTTFNWFFEILKWRLLVSSIKKITYQDAFEQSLGSLTASLFTPNRIGEYGAKAIYFARLQRKRILLLNLIGNITQMIITIFIGIIGLYLFIKHYNLDISFFHLSRGMILLFIVGVLAVFGIRQNKFKIKGFSIDRVKGFVKKLPLAIKLGAILLSFLRYAIFSFQFYFILKLFGVELSYFKIMIGITSMYLLASIVPTLFIFDVVIKGSVAVFLFSKMGVSEFSVLCAVMLMWTLNFVLPSLFGSYYVLNFNYTQDQD